MVKQVQYLDRHLSCYSLRDIDEDKYRETEWHHNVIQKKFRFNNHNCLENSKKKKNNKHKQKSSRRQKTTQ